MKLQLKFAAVLLPLLPLTGCIMGDSPAMVRADKYAPQQVVFASQELADGIAVGKIERTFDSAEIMHLTIPLRAVTDLGLSIDYRITWFDDNHNIVDAPTGWQTKMLTPGIWEEIRSNSASTHAKDFTMDIRYTQ